MNGFRSLSNLRFSESDLLKLWKQISKGSSDINKEVFRSHFDGISYSGSTTIVGAKSLGKTILVNTSSTQEKWSSDIIAKIRSQLMASSSDPRKVFNDLDTDSSGKLSSLEFRNGIRKLGLGLTS